ncbi:MAG: ribonuclease HI [Gammaproteobacteria bacterium]|nr:ribonuclease HI [Gammaproteobacteria bacterium]
MQRVEIHTDGACSGNPGPGGWAVLLRYGEHERELSGGEARTTNNRMELMAIITGLEALLRPCDVLVRSDSRYVLDGATRWMSGWRRNGWRTAAKTAVKNDDLWRRLDAAQTGHRIEWQWVKGHSGDPDNERVDALARQAIKQYRGGLS